MRRELLLAAITIGCLTPGASWAQDQAAAAPGLEPTLARVQAPVQARKVLVDAIQTRITPDRPYSAEAVTETTQALADGNRINRQSVARIYRDSAGRTRRESVGAAGTVQTITISDPVAGVAYTLEPETKVAYKLAGNMIAATRTPGRVVIDRVPAAGAVDVSQSKPRTAAVEGSGYASIARSAVGAGGRGGAVATATGSLKRDVLEPQNIEGVSATGTRTTNTIPAGQIGNAQEIRIVSEQWFSDDLQVLVLTKHSDPRSGETTYRLRNILRAEPDPSLFTVPADYTVQDRMVRR